MDFRLYIKGQECDLNDTFAVQLSYTAEDTESPSAVITEYSKTVTLPMTGKNDLIFNFMGPWTGYRTMKPTTSTRWKGYRCF